MQRGVARVLCALVLLALAACSGAGDDRDTEGGEQDGTPVLHWYTGPDRVDTAALAQACTLEADGAYEIEVEPLPEDFDERHAMLVRQLSADDDSMDIITLDNALTTEFASAQLLAPIPEDLKEPFAEGVFPDALLAASDGQQLVVAPWWFDPYLLWWRGTTAERAGLDVSEPVAWQDLLDGAERLDVGIEIDDPGGNALPALVNALVAGAGGTVLEGQGRFPEIGLDSGAGRAAADLVARLGDVGPEDGPSAEAPERFAARSGSFLLAPSSVVTDPALAGVARDLQWAAFPVVDEESVAPVDGAGLAVPLYAPRSDLSYDAISCLTSPTSMREMMIDSGHSAARATAYDDPAVIEGYPLADVTQPAVQTGATVPSTPYWPRVREALVSTWSPTGGVDPDRTPGLSERAVRDAVAGRLP
ncbi:extracellular solute-binding protein [Aeromicrobium sp. CF4.19]|uniref:extracellular solute-binding protein n=1 Tax=Aeromicrobium sp. CF4.19 TaxID=3373082 RepID=UPI003EE626EC